MKRSLLLPVIGLLGAASVGLAFRTGAAQVALIELTAGSLTTSGRRGTYFHRLARAGPLGRHRARQYALGWHRRSPGYGTFYLLFDRSLWRGYSRDDMRAMLGQPRQTGPDYDIWVYPDEDAEEFTTYLAVEYDGDTYARIGFPDGKTPSDDYRVNADYRLQREYDIYRAAPDAGG